MKHILQLVTLVLIHAYFVSPAYAHVTVSPKEVKVGERINFSVSVPPEKDLPTTQVRLVIPEGLTSVRPNVKPGWEIEVIKEGSGEEAVIKEIIWKNGSIAPELRDEFIFRAMVPKNSTTLNWKAYQTYADGSVVAWDIDPNSSQAKELDASSDFSETGPFSSTKVINDLEKETPTTQPSLNANTISIVALLVSSIAITLTFVKKK